MTNTRYKIVFAGELMPEAALHTVKDNLARLFKSDRHKIEVLFSGTAVALKRDLSEVEADKYLNALQRAGARVHKEQELSANLSQEVTDQQPAPATTSTATSNTVSEASPYATPKAQIAEELPPYAELKVFSATGRIGRLRYLAWWTACLFVGLLLILITSLLMGQGMSSLIGGVLIITTVIATIVVGLLICVQRLHDIGWSGWLLLLSLVPVAGSIFPLLILVVPGTSDANRYGPPPPPNGKGVKALAFTCLLVLILGTIAFPQYQQYRERAAQGQT